MLKLWKSLFITSLGRLKLANWFSQECHHPYHWQFWELSSAFTDHIKIFKEQYGYLLLLSTTNHKSTEEQCKHFLKDPFVRLRVEIVAGRQAHSKFHADSTKIPFVAHNNYIAFNTGEFYMMLYIHSQRETDLETVSEVCMIMSSMQTE